MADDIPEPIFELNPGRVDDEEFINFRTPDGQKLYKNATKPFKDEFDMTAANLKAHLHDHSTRAWIYAWNEPLFDIPIADEVEGDPEGPETANLCEEFGRINWARCQLHAATYVNTETRTAQQNQMLYILALNSLTVEAKKQIMLKKDMYTVEGVPVGAMLVKLIIECSYLASNATVRTVREKLTSLDEVMETNGSDIIKFNAKVEDLTNTLTSHGQTTEDLYIHLCKGYKAASDKKFVKWIEDKEDKHDEGEAMEPDELMLLAANKYKVAKDRGNWCQPDEQDAKIIALTAQIQKLASNRQRGGGREKDEALKGTGGGKKKQTKQTTWVKDRVAPTDGTLTKIVDGKELQWCSKHGSWAGHTADKCKGHGILAIPDDESEPKDEDSTSQPSNTKKTLKLAQAYAAVQDAAEDSE